MSSFITHLFDMILTALGVSSPDVRKRREIRKLQNELKAEAGTIFRSQNNLLLPPFAGAVLEFHKLLMPLYEIVKPTIDEFSNPNADRYWDYLIMLHFDQDLLHQKGSFSYEAITSRCDTAGDGEAELDMI